ncbi:hypothetical protein PCAR4_570123 [Paraburkholderia caribensis]|nr:hypothetical protein PCAR4_570123 [Paraburkholderia caribensis]
MMPEHLLPENFPILLAGPLVRAVKALGLRFRHGLTAMHIDSPPLAESCPAASVVTIYPQRITVAGNCNLVMESFN